MELVLRLEAMTGEAKPMNDDHEDCNQLPCGKRLCNVQSLQALAGLFHLSAFGWLLRELLEDYIPHLPPHIMGVSWIRQSSTRGQMSPDRNRSLSGHQPWLLCQ